MFCSFLFRFSLPTSHLFCFFHFLPSFSFFVCLFLTRSLRSQIFLLLIELKNVFVFLLLYLFLILRMLYRFVFHLLLLSCFTTHFVVCTGFAAIFFCTASVCVCVWVLFYLLTTFLFLLRYHSSVWPLKNQCQSV